MCGIRHHLMRSSAACSLLFASLAAQPALAQARTYNFDIPAEPLSNALQDYAAETHQQLMFTEAMTAGKMAPAVKGALGADAALDQLLVGSGLAAQHTPAGALILRPAASDLPLAAPRADAPPVQTVTVTGTRIVRNGYSAPTPVTVAPVAELQQTTPSNIADALNKLPEFSGSTTQSSSSNNAVGVQGNFLNLRSLGTNRTLVLLDGARVPATSYNGTVDVNTLPQLLVQRVEVVTGGASAVYGSDAVAGVVNYIVNTKFNGFKGVAQTGISTYGDVPSDRIGFAAGAPVFGNGHFVLSYEHYSEAGLNQGDRSYSSNYPAYTGTGSAATPYVLTNNVRLNSAAFGGYIASGPASIVGQQFVGNGTLALFNPGTPTGSSTASVGGDGAYYPGMSMLKPLQTDQLFGRFDYDIAPNISAFAQFSGALSDTRFTSSSAPPLNTIVYSGNPYLPANVQAALTAAKASSFTMSSVLQNLALQGAVVQKTQAFTGTIGLQGKILNDAFSWNAYYEHGEGQTRSDSTDNINNQHLYAALDAVKDPATGNIVCNVSLTAYASLYPGCQPLDIIGVGNESQAALNYIYQDTYWQALNKSDDVAASISGAAFNDWAGPVSVASNFEYRTQSLNETSNSNPTIAPSLTGLRSTWSGNAPVTPDQYNTVGPQHGANSVWEISGETVFPLLKGLPMAENLEVNGAVRYTDYSTSGPVTTWKVGVNYQPIQDLRFRATESRDIRAPSLYELFQAPSSGLSRVFDPHTNTTNYVTVDNVGNVNLQPEVGITRTAGVVYSPSWFPRFRMSVDWYKIEIKGVIGNLIGGINPANALATCQASGGTALQCQAIIRPLPYSNTTAANFPTLINNENINLAESYTDGVDIEASYGFEPADVHIPVPGHADIRVLFSYVPDEVSIASPGAAPVNTSGTTTSKDRLTGTFNYNLGPFSAAWQATYTGPHHQGSGVQGQIFAGPDFPAVVTHDLNLSYRFKAAAHDLQVFLTINNIFNQTPPVIPQITPSPSPGLTTPVSGDSRGRYFTTGVRFGF